MYEPCAVVFVAVVVVVFLSFISLNSLELFTYFTRQRETLVVERLKNYLP